MDTPALRTLLLAVLLLYLILQTAVCGDGKRLLEVGVFFFLKNKTTDKKCKQLRRQVNEQDHTTGRVLGG